MGADGEQCLFSGQQKQLPVRGEIKACHNSLSLNGSGLNELMFFLYHPRAAGGLSIGRGQGCRVLRRAVGLEGGRQPLPGDPEKNSPAVPAPNLPQLLGGLQTV